jgi:acetylornithine deacetylase/succinyl-diaminopimelate desuccinylase-like protein
VAHLVEQAGLAADAAIQCGATQNQVGLGNKGTFDLRLTVLGSPSHVSLPWLGRNAIQGARRLMDLLDAIQISEGESHPALGRPTLTVHAIKSGPYDVRTVPGACRITVDRRVLPGDDLFQKYAELVAQIPDEVDGFTIVKEMGFYQYPNEVSRDAEIVRAISTAIQAATGREPSYFYKHGALDAGYLNTKAKIPTVMFGSGEPRFAHTDQEMVAVQQAFEAMQVYALTALLLLA